MPSSHSGVSALWVEAAALGNTSTDGAAGMGAPAYGGLAGEKEPPEEQLRANGCGSLVILESPEKRRRSKSSRKHRQRSRKSGKRHAQRQDRCRQTAAPSDACESGWRYEEICGAATGISSPRQSKTKPRHIPDGGTEEGWRWKELVGGGSSPGDENFNSIQKVEKLDSKPDRSTCEDGWRYEEICGAATFASSPRRRKTKSKHVPRGDVEDNWRWKEMMGGGAGSAESHSEHAEESKSDMVALRSSETEVEDSLKVGDLVVLGDGVQSEYRGHPAIVTKVAEAHCTVVVLDDERRIGIGECWPAFCDVSLESCALRLGTRVVIGGMKGSRTKHFNGLTGIISEHPREGHPTFIKKPSCPDAAQLVICVVFDDTVAAKERSALLEPRFLKSLQDVTSDMAKLALQLQASFE